MKQPTNLISKTKSWFLSWLKIIRKVYEKFYFVIKLFEKLFASKPDSEVAYKKIADFYKGSSSYTMIDQFELKWNILQPAVFTIPFMVLIIFFNLLESSIFKQK